MRNRSWPAAALLLAACSVSQSYPTVISRPALDVPERFVLEDGGPVTGTPGVAPCRSPLRDPRGGEPLVMARADRGAGDYRADGRYGIGPRELIRIDCATGAPLGIVRA